MIRSDKIKNSLYKGVGFRQSTLSGYPTIDADNSTSDSGLYFQDASFLVTIKNIKETQENPSITDEQFNALLKQMHESCIIDVCNKVVHGKSDHIQSVNLYPYEKIYENTLSVDSKFNGFKIEPIYDNNLAAKVSFIELCFDSAKTFNVYLYNSNKPNTPIQTQSVTTVANESVVYNVNWIIADDVTFKGGYFYLGYFEDDLNGALPIARDYELSTVQRSTRCFYIDPVKLDHTSTRIDVSSYESKSDTGGLNIGVEIYNDYTELLIRNKNLLWNAIYTQMAVKVLDLILKSTRSNRTERLTDKMVGDINLELHGYKDEHAFIEGLIKQNNRNIADIRNTLFYKPKIVRGTLR